MRKLLRSLRTLYSARFPTLITYMLQASEYQVGPYLAWFWQTQDFSKVIVRRDLQKTKVARLFLLAIRVGVIIEILIGLLLIYLNIFNHLTAGWVFGAAIIIAYPIVWANLVCLPLVMGREIVAKPKERMLIEHSKSVFEKHKAIKIAVAGSYGKTSMKELLLSVLSQGLNVAATPANKNVAISHAAFAKKLTGQEDVLIVEFGEGGPGDVARFTATVKPDRALITGLSPAHLDKYKTLKAAGEDIFSLYNLVDKAKIYVNGESKAAKDFINSDYLTYDRNGALGWKVDNLSSSISGLKFELVKGNHRLKLTSSLLGRHEVGPLSIVAALAKELGLSDQQITDGIKAAKPYEHRMEPRNLNGAWIIDDTYNGNIEGIRVGSELLGELKANRKIYVSPGLVDQGKETKAVHLEMGKLIARAKPDLVILMQNSVSEYIKDGLREAGYSGELRIEDNPLQFYNNLGDFIAAGDLVLMQNDWTDNYR